MIRLHITGASGSGTSTLGQALSEHLGIARFDTDDFYWQPSEPPYTEKQPIGERLRLLNTAFAEAGSWILSGSIGLWGAPLIPQFDLVIFLSVPTATRLERLRRRETERYGSRIEPGGDRHEASAAFLEWAANYETGLSQGRSRDLHEAWLKMLPCPVLRLDGDRPVDIQRADSLAAIAKHGLPV
ncbi:AAA family ATPase [Pelagibius sp.]|uniref:AAA family ATPase n=1 Tax=Pelagibius sp. TaxID=1931238 RepID=UPI00262D1987|nr:AAA family ATPase [Pelagibius sp.]